MNVKCKWTGTDIKEKQLTEDELMEFLDKKEKKLHKMTPNIDPKAEENLKKEFS